MTGYAPGQTYRLPLTFVEAGPDATPTVAVRRNFSTVSPTVTVSGSGLQWGVSFAIPSDWADGDTVQVIVSWERNGEAEQVDDTFVVGTANTVVEVRAAAGALSGLRVDGGEGMDPFYQGERWQPVAPFAASQAGATVEMRLGNPNGSPALVLSGVVAGDGLSATFDATDVQTAALEPGTYPVQVWRTSGAKKVLYTSTVRVLADIPAA